MLNFKKSNSYKQINKFFFEMLGTIIGSFFMAIGVSLFLLPNQLSSGGISGIATIAYYLFSLPMGITIIIINIPLFVFAIFKVGKSFFIKSVIGTIFLSFFIDYLDKFQALTNDNLLASIYGGIILGIGTAIILKSHSSTGGSDLVSYIINKQNPTIQTSKILVIIDATIIFLNMIFLKEIEIGLYSAISIFIMGKMLDILFEGIYFTKLAIIISDKSEEIAKRIEKNIKRGSTGLYGKGMYTGEEKLILMCAVSRNNLEKLKLEAKSVDPDSFIIITNSREVVGLDFKKDIVKKHLLFLRCFFSSFLFLFFFF